MEFSSTADLSYAIVVAACVLGACLVVAIDILVTRDKDEEQKEVEPYWPVGPDDEE